MKALLALTLVPTICLSMNLSNFDGRYSLQFHQGDEGQFVDPCPEILNVTYDQEKNEIESDYFHFEKINEGKYQDPGEYGQRETFTNGQSVINEYTARRFFNSYWSAKSYSLDNSFEQLTVTKKDDDGTNLKCVYIRQ